MFTGPKTLCLAGVMLCHVQVVRAQMPGETQAATVTLPAPFMAGPLGFGSSPTMVTAGTLGSWYIDGAFSGLALAQGPSDPGDRPLLGDIGNAQLFLQKSSGLLQFYVQAGLYAIPVLGVPYAHTTDASQTLRKLFGPLPQAFLKIAPADSFSIQAGKLPTLIGGEYSFTVENMNIARGLLWNQEPAVSRGVQVNVITGPLAFALSVNDGFASGRYSWLSGSASWTIDMANMLMLAAGANLASTAVNTLATPQAQNNSSIYNLIYTYTGRKLTLTPYLQYTRVPDTPSLGLAPGGSSWGAATLASFAVSENVALGARAEILSTRTDGSGPHAVNLLFGPGSSAFSFTVTPTYMVHRWFARTELSLVRIVHVTIPDGFGAHGDKRLQARGLLECGVVF